MFKITTKTKMETLKEVLTLNREQVEKTLQESIDYTLNPKHNAKRSDLVDLVKEVMSELGDKFKTPETKDTKTKTENMVKKPKAKSAPAEEPEEDEAESEEDEDEPEDEPEEEEKPKAKKTSAKKSSGAKKSPKKSSKKEDGVTALETVDSPKAVQLAKMFPETIKVGDETFKVDHSIKKLEDMADGEYELAFYWTKRHLKQFPYFNTWLGQPKSFPNDLDTAQLIYVSDEGKVAYCVSDSTEAVYTVLPDDLEEVEGLRIGSGSSIEFQIYKKVEEDK